MHARARILLLGVAAAAALGAGIAASWMRSPRQPAPPPEAVLPLPAPAESPDLADLSQADRCRALLRTDPEAAQISAAEWRDAQGGEPAEQCEALAVLALGDPIEAATRLEAIAARSSVPRPARAALFAQAAQAWLIAGDANRSFGAATLALTLTPDDLELLVDRAAALGALGRYREALTDLDRVLALDPDRPDALVFRAAAMRQLDRTDVARRDVDRALAIEPDNAEGLLERGILRQLAGDDEGARRDWERVMTVAPGSAAADLAAQNLALSEAGPVQR
jgi:tetratricopeptide (TPR) repeat protein